MDESGDLGVGDKASAYLTLAAIVTVDPKPLERIPQKIRRRKLKKSLARKPELKFHNSDPRIRLLTLKMVASLEDVRIASIVLEKSRLRSKLTENPDELYRRTCGLLMSEIARTEKQVRTFNVVFDARRGKRSKGVDFDRYIEQRIQQEYRERCLIPPTVAVSRFDSSHSGGLQVADFVAGAIQRKHELDDDGYYRIIAPKMVAETRVPPL